MGSHSDAHVVDARVDDTSLQHRVLAASIASVVSTILVNPLDVVKSQLQARVASGQHAVVAASSRAHAHSSPALTCALYGGGRPAGATQCGIATQMGSTAAAVANRSNARAGNSLLQLQRILRREGLPGLWRGTNLGVLMTVPLISIYIPLYDTLRNLMPHDAPLAPLAAGVTARAAAVAATSPIEFVRVRVQAAEAAQGAMASTVRARSSTAAAAGASATVGAGVWSSGGGTGRAGTKLLREALRCVAGEVAVRPSLRQRVAFLWTGCAASMAKDLPFAAIYWSLLEPCRHALLPGNQGIGDADPVSAGELAVANAAAAALAAAAAAAATHPMDVVKTGAQASAGPTSVPRGLWQSLRAITAKAGVRGLFTALGPRVARSSLAYALVMSAYEVTKLLIVEPDGIITQ